MTGWRANVVVFAILAAAFCADSIGDFLFPPRAPAHLTNERDF